ncbi:hypothetical protein [Dysgonomonas sp. 521]|uniref:hypothetical protein n=1 Tax=Dysgonomonas sp. 521 TaxID=2302932 RepID=UPI0013D5F210|nr:hypothetical protein [Dysgonomonas sp. 521]
MQTKIENWCRNNIDKVLHFIVGLLLAQLAYLWVWFLLFPLIAGLGKEFIDKYVRKTGFTWMDTIATWMGAIPIAILLLIDKYIL